MALDIHRQVFRIHPAGGGVFLELQEFDHLLAFLGLHFQQDFRGALLGQIGQQVGGRVGLHFFDDFGGAFRIERLDDRLLHLGLDFFQGPGGHVFVEGLEHGFALVGSQIFDDIGDVGGMQFGQALVGNLEFHPPRGIGFDQVDEVPGNGPRAEFAATELARPAAEPRPSAAAALRPAGPHRPTHFQDWPVADRFLKQVEIVYPNDFPAKNVDDLLVEQIAAQQKHAFRSVADGPVGGRRRRYGCRR